MFYDTYANLCTKKGVSESKAAESIGLNRSAVIKWKKGAVPGGQTIQKLADYFNVSVDRLLGTEKAPTQEGERQISDDDIRAAFFGGADDLSEEEMNAMWEDAKDYVQYKLEQRRRKKNGGAD